ncbi:MAG: prenyltransferase/squalene oxidase repeat-containing protein [Gemmataceae bacterium]
MKTGVLTLLLLTGGGPVATAAEANAEQKATARGLAWLAKQQQDAGYWAHITEVQGPIRGNPVQYPCSLTSLAGLALLMEGSTTSQGTYARELSLSVDWLLTQQHEDGHIGGDNASERNRYIFPHSYAMLFLAQVLDSEAEGPRRKQIEKVLARAVEFSVKAQTSQGGWGYVAAAEGSDYDEGCATITQLRALIAVRTAGIAVPRTALDKGVEYLVKGTTERGGVVYSSRQLKNGPQPGSERPPLTAAALTCLVEAGQHDAPIVRKWLVYCQRAVPVNVKQRSMVDEYAEHHYGAALCQLGDKRIAELLPDSKKPCLWSAYRDQLFPILLRDQRDDGSWNTNSVGPVFSTAMALSVLQLERSPLPLHQH